MLGMVYWQGSNKGLLPPSASHQSSLEKIGG
jgi:hypothetical protein